MSGHMFLAEALIEVEGPVGRIMLLGYKLNSSKVAGSPGIPPSNATFLILCTEEFLADTFARALQEMIDDGQKLNDEEMSNEVQQLGKGRFLFMTPAFRVDHRGLTNEWAHKISTLVGIQMLIDYHHRH